jgi:DNA-binding NtrC family response regulator
LTAYDWPGNVRELENTIERAVVLGTTEWILPEDLPEAVLETKMPNGSTRTYHAAVVQNKKQIILRALEEAKMDHSEAARLLGIHPNYLQRLIRNLNVHAG